MGDERELVIVVMGVSGSGKSTIGALLADRLELPFFDGDDFHPESNKAKMAGGTPLDDEDRRPWLETLAGKLAEWERGDGAVLACSALKESYRQILRSRAENVVFVHLAGDPDLIRQRMEARRHFMKPEMLASQMETLEPPTDAITVPIGREPSQIVGDILEKLPT